MKVELGWNLKQHQLIDLMDILHHENYTNTGLSTGNDGVNDVCSGLWTYIEKVNETAWDDEKPELETHLQEVIDIRIRIDTHPCPCVWSPWVQWSACTTTCERGLRFRERQIEKDAINNGTECRGPSEEDEVCNADVCCRKCKIQISIRLNRNMISLLGTIHLVRTQFLAIFDPPPSPWYAK